MWRTVWRRLHGAVPPRLHSNTLRGLSFGSPPSLHRRKNELESGTALDFFARAYGVSLLAFACAIYKSMGTMNYPVAVGNLLGNILAQFMFFRALSNKDAETGMWKVQNIVSLLPLFLAYRKFISF